MNSHRSAKVLWPKTSTAPCRTKNLATIVQNRTPQKRTNHTRKLAIEHAKISRLSGLLLWAFWASVSSSVSHPGCTSHLESAKCPMASCNAVLFQAHRPRILTEKHLTNSLYKVDNLSMHADHNWRLSHDLESAKKEFAASKAESSSSAMHPKTYGPVQHMGHADMHIERHTHTNQLTQKM